MFAFSNMVEEVAYADDYKAILLYINVACPRVPTVEF